MQRKVASGAAQSSTRYEDGTRVKMTDPPIIRVRAEQLARNLMSAEERMFRVSTQGVALHPEEYDLYMDFVGHRVYRRL